MTSSVLQGECTAQLRADLLSESLPVCHTPARRCTSEMRSTFPSSFQELPNSMDSAALSFQQMSQIQLTSQSCITMTCPVGGARQDVLLLHLHSLSIPNPSSIFHLQAFSERPLLCHHSSQCYYCLSPLKLWHMSAHIQPKFFEVPQITQVHFRERDGLLRWNRMWEPGAWPGMWHCGNWPRQWR